MERGLFAGVSSVEATRRAELHPSCSFHVIEWIRPDYSGWFLDQRRVALLGRVPGRTLADRASPRGRACQCVDIPQGGRVGHAARTVPCGSYPRNWYVL